jgi:hypothetical protein
MCSIDEAWAGQTFGGKPVVSQSDIHKSYMSLPDDITTHNNQFSLKYNDEPKSRDLSRGINSKLSREARVPKINRNSDNANINFSSTMPPYNNYGGINPRPDYMQIYDDALPAPIMSGEQFTDINNAYNISNTLNDFMKRGDNTNILLNEDNDTDRQTINNKFNNRKLNNFTNIKKQSKYDSSDNSDIESGNPNNVYHNDAQILIILQQIINKLDSLEYNMQSLHHNKSKNMYDIILYIIFGMILSFLLFSILSSKK